MKVLALDLATTTGAAVGIPGAAPKLFTERFGDPDENHLVRFSRCLNWINLMIKEHQPTVIAIEEPIASGVVGKKDRIFLAAGYRGCVLGVAGMRKLRLEEYSVSQIRKHFIGTSTLKRKQAKETVLRECLSRGWKASNDNEGDAAALFDFVLAKNGFQVEPNGLFGGNTYEHPNSRRGA